MLLNFAECVRKAVGEVHFVVLVFKVIAKTKFKILFASFESLRSVIQSTWLITYEIAAFLPTFVSAPFDTNTHSLVVETLRLGEVKYREVNIAYVILVLY